MDTDNKKELMDMKDVHAEMKKDVKEEVHDCRKYTKMMQTAKMAGHDELAHYLYEIAKDEYSHASFLYDWLWKSGVEIPEEDKAAYMSLKEEVHEMFQ